MKLIIDRFEGYFAVCEDENKSMVNLNKDELPSGVKEGDVLVVIGNEIRVDVRATEARINRMKQMEEDIWE